MNSENEFSNVEMCGIFPQKNLAITVAEGVFKVAIPSIAILLLAFGAYKYNYTLSVKTFGVELNLGSSYK